MERSQIRMYFSFNESPYCASFRAGRFDFTLVSVHIAEGSHHGAVGVNLREQEIKELVKFIKREARRAQGTVFDPDFFLVGDFNIQTDGDRFFQALTGGDAPRFEMPDGMNSQGTNFDQTKTFDKIAWIPSDEFEFTGKFGVIPFGNALYIRKLDNQKMQHEKKLVIICHFGPSFALRN